MASDFLPDGGDGSSGAAKVAPLSHAPERNREEPQGPRRPSVRARAYEDLDGGLGREVYFRPHRYPLADLGPVRPEVGFDFAGERHACVLHDVSQNGVAFEWSGAAPMEPGARVMDLAVTFDGHEAYRGAATVTSVRRVGERVVAGASFVDSLMNVDDVIALRDVQAFAAAGSTDLGLARAPWRVAGHERFKALVGELRLFLEDAQQRLGELERALPWDVVHAEAPTPARDALVARVRAEFVDEFIRRSEEIDVEVRRAAPSDFAALKEISQRNLQTYFMQAPCMYRACFKPLGYPGDFEVMKYMYENQFAGPTLFAKALSMAILTTRPGHSVRARKDLVRERLSAAIDAREATGEPLRVLSVAAGPAQEVYELLKRRERIASPVDIVLFDQDKSALSYAYGRTSPVVNARWSKTVSVTYLHDSIKRLLRDRTLFARFDAFDVTFCCGLFDYLEMPTAVALTRNLYASVAPGGSLLLGNMVPSSPNRWFMEMNLDWNLKYKTHEELLAMGRQAAPDAQVEIAEEPWGVNPFVVLTRG